MESNLKVYLQKRLESQALSQAEACEALSIMGGGHANNSQIAAFIASYIMLPVSVAELMGFREAMLSLAHILDFSDLDPMDVCGTGGDGKDTFNISTTSAFIVAGAGQKVAKHGNHGVSSSVGSSTVLEYLGATFTNNQSVLKSQLERAGICFLHAPLFHPAMRHVGPIRKELGMKTFFNMLGPLLNPANVQKQLTGVYSAEVQHLYNQVFLNSNAQYGIVFGTDGYDEISLTGNFILESSRGKEIIGPEQFNFQKTEPSALHSGANLQQSAQILTDILQNQGTKPQTEVAIANAATALYIADKKLDWSTAIHKATESLQSGAAFQSFKKFLE